MGDRLLRYMADQAQPVRLYSPNPDAPQWAGLPPTEEPRPSFGNRLWNAVKNAPGQLWGMLPAEAQKAYTSGLNTLVDMSTPASVRDYTTSAQDTARSVAQGDGWGTATNALATVNAALGAIPVAGMGVTLARKGAQEVGEAVGRGAAKTIRAYHGSPHNFDRFDLSKIGTGEGAQAYGHGLYFAENEGIARNYRDALAGSGYRINGKEYSPYTTQTTATVGNYAADALNRFKGDTKAAIEWLRGGGPTSEEAAKLLAKKGTTIEPWNGHMYEVQINADPAKFLDWDKPLAQQPMEIRNLVDTVSQGGIKGRLITPESTGADLYHAMKSSDAARRFGYQNWSTTGPAEYLRDTDIPGIKYLDAGSRTAGDGSRNYVVFDDKLIEILRKYGLLPFAGAAGMAALPTENDGMVR